MRSGRIFSEHGHKEGVDKGYCQYAKEVAEHVVGACFCGFSVVEDGELDDVSGGRRSNCQEGDSCGRDVFRMVCQESAGVEGRHGQEGQCDKADQDDEEGFFQVKAAEEAAFCEYHSDDEHGNGAYGAGEHFHGGIDRSGKGDPGKDEEDAGKDSQDIGVEEKLFPVDPDRALHAAGSMGPEDQVEGELVGAAVKHHFLSHRHADDGENEVTAVCVDDGHFLYHAKQAHPAQDGCRGNEDEVGRNGEDHRQEVSPDFFRRQFDLEG